MIPGIRLVITVRKYISIGYLN